MLTLILPTWTDLSSVVQPAFVLSAILFVSCAFLALREVQ